MRLVFTSYSVTPEFSDPAAWIERISGYAEIMEQLAVHHKVYGIERINYEGVCHRKGVAYLFLKMKKQNYFPFRLHRLVKELRPDVVFINGFIFPLQILQLRMQLGKRARIVILHRAEKPFNGVKRQLQRMADRCVDAYCFSSAEIGEEWMQKKIIRRKSKIHEIIQGSSIFGSGHKEEASAGPGPSGQPIFLWVGRLNANKDPLTVVRAFKQYLVAQPAARLYMIFKEADLLSEVEEAIKAGKDDSASIALVGYVRHSHLEKWYRGADFIISGSHYEGSGIAISEAMSCGCIPIVTRIASFRSMTADGSCGLLYQPGDESDLMFALTRTGALDLVAERKKVLDQFSKELSFEAIAKKLNRIIAGD